MEDKGAEDLLGRCRAIFRMRPDSQLDPAQKRAWRNAAPLVAETKPEEWDQLEAYYSATLADREDFRRRDLATLLNNWNGEITRARDWCRKAGWTPPRQPAATPADWAQLVGIVLDRDYPDDPPKTFPTWDAVPDWLRGEVSTTAAVELEKAAPDGWRAAITLLQEEGDLPPGDFAEWPGVPLPVRIQLRTALDRSADAPAPQTDPLALGEADDRILKMPSTLRTPSHES